MHPHSLLGYDADGNITHTLDYMVRYADDPARTPLGLVDFAAMEAAGMEMTAVWTADGAKGSKVWPEWLGVRAHEFRVELEGPPGGKRIRALVHKVSGHRRERAAIDRAIRDRIAATPSGAPADLRDLVGGPSRPVAVDGDGMTIAVARVDPDALPSLPLLSVMTGPV